MSTIEANPLSCPRCRSKACLFGNLEPNDSDRSFDGYFYPLYISNSFWRLTPAVHIPEANRFYACSDCGHLWSQLDIEDFKAVLAKNGWNGQPQIKPKKRRPYFQWLLAAIIFGLLGLIAWLKFIE